MTIGTFEAKTHFSELIDEVQKGKDFIVTKRGKPVAKIIPFNENTSLRKEILLKLLKYKTTTDESFGILDAIQEGRE